MSDDHWNLFRTYWAGFFTSMLGDSLTLVALPVAAFAIGGSSVLVGLVDMMEILSGIAFGTLLGVLADRSDPRAVLVATDLARAALLAGLATLAAFGAQRAWSILVVAFALGVLRALHDGGESTLLARIVPADREMQAFARLSVAESTGRMIGPFMGGLALEVGLWAAFGFDAATFVAAAAAVVLIPRRVVRRAVHPASRPSATVRSDLAIAVTAIRAQPTYLALVGVGAFGNLAGLTMAGLFVPFATDVLHLGSVGFGFGVLLALLGLGGLVADWFVNRQPRHDPRAAGLAMAAVAASVFLAGLVPHLATSVLAMLVTGGGVSYYQANYSAYRQTIFAPEMFGRVSMATRTAFYVTMMVGFVSGGYISDGLGPDRMFMLFGAVSLAGVLVVGTIPLDPDPDPVSG